MSEDAKRIVLPNAEKGLEKKYLKKDADRFAKMMSKAYDVNNLWDLIGAVYCVSNDEFSLGPDSEYTFRICVNYAYINNSLKIYFQFSSESNPYDPSTFGGEYLFLYKKGISIEQATTLVEITGFDDPSIERFISMYGNGFLDGAKEFLEETLKAKDEPDLFDDLFPEDDFLEDDESLEPKQAKVVKLNPNSEIKENMKIRKQALRISETKLRNIVKKVIMEEIGDIYDMERWKADGSLKLKDGQIVSDDVIEYLRNSMPPAYDGVDYFQPGDPYDHDRKTGRALYLTFNGNKYIGLKPKCSLWAGKANINESVDMQVSKTILSQLGGNRFVVMTGAKDFVAIDNGLKFRIGRNGSSANIVKIILQGDDTYTMQFWKVSNFNPYKYLTKYVEKGLSSEEIKAKMAQAEKKAEPKMLKEYKGLYFDQLQEFFTEYTGLYTRL